MTERTTATATERHLTDIGRAIVTACTNAGLVEEPPVPLVEPPATDLLFANSAVLALAGRVDDLGERPFVVAQPCVRAHNLSSWGTPTYSTEWLTCFTMVGVFATSLDRVCELTAAMLEVVEPVRTRSVRITAAARDSDPVGRLSTSFDAAGRTHDVVVDQPTPDHQRSRKPDYYDWKFGRLEMLDRGLTLALEQADGSWRDVGNVIAFARDGSESSFGLGAGVETLVAAAGSAPSLVDVTGAGATFPRRDVPSIGLADFCRAIVWLDRSGVTPSARGAGSILRKVAQGARDLAFSTGLSADALKACLAELHEAAEVAGSPAASSVGGTPTDHAVDSRDVVFPANLFRAHTFAFSLDGDTDAAEALDPRLAALVGTGDGESWVDEVRSDPQPTGVLVEVRVTLSRQCDAKRASYSELKASVEHNARDVGFVPRVAGR